MLLRGTLKLAMSRKPSTRSSMRQRRATVHVPRKNMKAAEREEMIVNAAICFFADIGFGGQTRELAKRIGITHPAIYRHFANKEALIERVYQEVYVRRWNTSWDTLITDSTKSLEDRLCKFYVQYFAQIFDYNWVRIFLFSGLRSQTITCRYTALIERKVIGPLCREIRQYVADRDSSKISGPITEQEREAVWGLHGQIFYIAIRIFVYGMEKPSNLEGVIVSHIKRFIRGLG